MQQQSGLHCGCDDISVGSPKRYFGIIYTAEQYTALKSGCDGISVGWEPQEHTWSNHYQMLPLLPVIVTIVIPIIIIIILIIVIMIIVNIFEVKT